MQKSDFRRAVTNDMQEAYANGISGHFTDAMLMHKDWQIDLSEIDSPVHLWHGEQDTLSPVQNVRRLAKQIPNCQSRFLPDAGHFLIDLPEVVEDVRLLVGHL